MKKKILVTEDSVTVSAMIKQALEDEGNGEGVASPDGTGAGEGGPGRGRSALPLG